MDDSNGWLAIDHNTHHGGHVLVQTLCNQTQQTHAPWWSRTRTNPLQSHTANSCTMVVTYSYKPSAITHNKLIHHSAVIALCLNRLETGIDNIYHRTIRCMHTASQFMVHKVCVCVCVCVCGGGGIYVYVCV